MSAITLTPVTQLYLASGKKPGYAQVLSCRRHAGEGGKASEVSTVFLDEKNSEVCVYRERKGITLLRAAGKYATRIIDTASDGFFMALFFHHDKGRRLGLAVIQFDQTKATRLTGDPVDYSEKLDSLLMPLVSSGKNCKGITASLNISCSCLKNTSLGLLLSTVLSTPAGERFVVVGSLWDNRWKYFKLDAAFGIPGSLCIRSYRVVSVVSCEVSTPIDQEISTISPTIELALSVFEEIAHVISKDNGNKNSVPSSGGACCCMILREAVFSLDDNDPIIRVCYQSQLFPLPQGAQGGFQATPLCRIYADNEQYRYAAVVSLPTQSYLVHLRRSPFNMELVAACTKIGLQGLPHGVAWMRLSHPSRPEEGLQAVLLLSQDYRLYAAEVFGNVINLEVEQGSNAVVFVPPVKKTRFDSSQHVVESRRNSTRLLRVGEEEVICSNGLLAVVLRVTALAIDGSMPEALRHYPLLFIDEEGPERRYETLVKILDHIGKISNVDRTELLQLVFQRILPLLRCSGSSQREVFLTQRVFQVLLNIAVPKSASEWRTMWNLTMVLQKILLKHSRDNSVVYTDMFFIQLAENYIHSHETGVEQEQAREALLNIVSSELKDTWKQFVQEQDDDVTFVLDSLAERVSLVPLAEECVRRMVVVTALSNGTHVVSVGNRVSHIIHVIATALLASCLEVPLYVNRDNDSGQMVCQITQEGEASLFLPPCTLKNRAIFEYALTLSTDLLCAVSPDTPLSLCAQALLSMIMARRHHVVSTFLQVFALPLVEYLMPLGSSLCENVHLLSECSASVFLNETTLFKKILSEPGPSDILCVLCGGSLINDYFNTNLWRHMGNILSKDTQTLILAAVLHAMTDRLIAAQNNYSTSVMKLLLTDDLEHLSFREKTMSMETCRERLGIVMNRLEHVWAAVAPWFPYKVEDISSSVLSSSTAATQDGKRDAETIFHGSVVSRTCVMCFRLLALVGYSYRAEEQIDELLGRGGGSKTSIIVRAALLLLQTIDNLKGTALPVESLQWRCVDLAAMSVPVCAEAPGLASFVLEILQLSETSLTVITPLKQYYYTVVDRLTEVKKSNDGDDGNAGNYDAVFNDARAQLRTRQSFNLTKKNKSPIYFLWSTRGGADMPKWPGDHNLPARQYLINTDWVDIMWPIEFVPHIFEDCLRCTQERIHTCDVANGPAEEEHSPQFSHALFYQLCTLSPPVRNHALLSFTQATDAGRMKRPGLRSKENQVTKDFMPPSSFIGSRTLTPANNDVAAAAPPLSLRAKGTTVVNPPLALTSRKVIENDDLLTTSSSNSYSSQVHDVHYSPPRFSANTGGNANGGVVIAGARTGATAAAAATSLFPPEDVAWWETDKSLVGATRRQCVVMKQLEDIDITITSSATSYTTETSERGMTHSSYEVNKHTRSSSFSPRRCKKHNVHHYRCAKHREHRIYNREKYHSGGRSYHANKTAELHPPRIKSLSPPKEKSPRSIKLLQFQNVLRPPDLPPKMATADNVQLVKPRGLERKDDVGSPPKLLSLHAKPHVPRVKLFSWEGAENNCGEFEGINANINSAGIGQSSGLLFPTSQTQSPARALRPPSLPPSSVFVNPPPLLTLKVPVSAGVARPEVTATTTNQATVVKNSMQVEDRRIANADEDSLGHVSVPTSSFTVPVTPTPAPSTLKYKAQVNTTAPSVTFVPHGVMQPSSYPESQTGFRPTSIFSPNLLRKEVDTVKVTGTQQPPLVPTASEPVCMPAENNTFHVSSLKEPVLSPSEAVAFHKYVDDLKAMGAAAVPLPLPPGSGQPLPAPTPSVIPLGVSPQPSWSEPTTTSTHQHQQQQQQQEDILGVVKEMLLQHEERQARQFHGVLEELRSATHRFASLANSPTPGIQQQQQQQRQRQESQGLSAMEQASLLRHTIQQKDRLLMMNQDLLELHARAQRLGTAPLEKETQSTVSLHAISSAQFNRPMATPVIPVSPIPVPSFTTTPAMKREIETVSSGVQTNLEVNKKMDDTNTVTMPTRTAAPPPPPVTSVTPAEVTPSVPPAPQVVADDMHRGVTSVIPDPTSATSINRSLLSFQQINAELLRVNATADDMERAIRESRDILNKHASLSSGYSAALDGSLMMDAARRRTASLEMQLAMLNSTSAMPSYFDKAREKETGKWCDPSEFNEEMPGRHVFISSIDEVDNTVVDGTEGIPRKASSPSSPSKFIFTSEKAEAPSDSSLEFNPPPTRVPDPKVERLVEHVFECQTDETLRRDSAAVGVGPKEAQAGSLHTSGSRAHTVEPTAMSPVTTPPHVTKRETPLRPRDPNSSTPQRAIDLGQLYAAAESSNKKLTARKSVSPAKPKARVSPSRHSVPEKFAMYMPPADTRKTRRTNSSNSKIVSSAPDLHQSSMIHGKNATAATATTTVKTMESKGSRARPLSSGRDNRRLETLAMHTSKRLADLQRAFL